MSDGNKKLGWVKWFNEAKGYGFIAPADRGTDIFVHISSVRNIPEAGDQVSFVVGKGRDGRLGAQKVEIAGT